MSSVGRRAIVVSLLRSGSGGQHPAPVTLKLSGYDTEEDRSTQLLLDDIAQDPELNTRVTALQLEGFVLDRALTAPFPNLKQLALHNVSILSPGALPSFVPAWGQVTTVALDLITVADDEDVQAAVQACLSQLPAICSLAITTDCEPRPFEDNPEVLARITSLTLKGHYDPGWVEIPLESMPRLRVFDASSDEFGMFPVHLVGLLQQSAHCLKVLKLSWIEGRDDDDNDDDDDDDEEEEEELGWEGLGPIAGQGLELLHLTRGLPKIRDPHQLTLLPWEAPAAVHVERLVLDEEDPQFEVALLVGTCKKLVVSSVVAQFLTPGDAQHQQNMVAALKPVAHTITGVAVYEAGELTEAGAAAFGALLGGRITWLEFWGAPTSSALMALLQQCTSLQTIAINTGIASDTGVVMTAIHEGLVQWCPGVQPIQLQVGAYMMQDQYEQVVQLAAGLHTHNARVQIGVINQRE